MIWVIAGLYVLAAALPTVGFVGLLRSGHAAVRKAEQLVDERGYSHITFDDVFEAASPKGEDIRDPAYAARRRARIDTGLVGGGLLCGAVASIWSLFMSCSC